MATLTVYHVPTGAGKYRTHVNLASHPTNTAAIAGGADKAFGVELFNFDDVPSCNVADGANIYIEKVFIDLDLEESDGNITADTPDLGLGTIVGTGVVNVLSTPTTFENILTGQTINDCNGTNEVTVVRTEGLITATQLALGSSCYLNIADGWAAGGEGANGLVCTGDIVIDWEVLPVITS